MPGKRETPPTPTPTVERHVVYSNRDGELVVGPLDTRSAADDECDRLMREQMRNWLAGSETSIGTPIEPPGYRVETIDVPDPDAQRAEIEFALDSVADDRKRDVPEGIERERWVAALDCAEENLRGQLDAR